METRQAALGFKATYCVRTRQDIPEVGLSGPLAFAGCRIHFGVKPHAVVSGTDEASGLLLGPRTAPWAVDLPFLDPFHGSTVIRSNILFRLLDVAIYIPTAVLRSHARFHLNVSVQDVYLLDEVIYIYPLRGSAVLRSTFFPSVTPRLGFPPAWRSYILPFVYF